MAQSLVAAARREGFALADLVYDAQQVYNLFIRYGPQLAAHR